MKNYKDLIHQILLDGDKVVDRTGVGTKGIFGTRLEWDLTKGFPAVTSKSLAWKAVVSELIWFISGSSNVEDLRTILHGEGSDKKTIWDENYENQGRALGYSNGDLGPVYGSQWRNFGGVDQLQELVDSINKGVETGIHSRRNIVSAWNVPEVPNMALPPCHYVFQVHVNSRNELSLMWHQRSVDVFLGLPFNIASYALLAHILAEITGTTAKKLIFTGGDTHIYLNHMEAVSTLLSNPTHQLPTLSLPNLNSLDDIVNNTSVSDYKLNNYTHSGVIKAPMAV